MEVRDGLAAVAAMVDDEAVAVGSEAQGLGDAGGGEEEMTEQGLIGGRGLAEAWDGLAWDDEDVAGGLGVDIVEGDQLVVLVHEGGGYFLVADFLEEGLVHGEGGGWGRGLADDQGGLSGLGVGAPALAEVGDDLVVEVLAAGAPAAGGGDLFDAGSEALESEDGGVAFELEVHLVAKALEEGQLEASSGLGGQLAQVGDSDGAWGWGILFGLDLEAEVAEDAGQGGREFGDGDSIAVQFAFEVVEDGAGGLVEDVRVEGGGGFAHEFDGDLLGRAGDGISLGRFEEEAIGMEPDHEPASSFWTSWTKSVASWNRR